MAHRRVVVAATVARTGTAVGAAVALAVADGRTGTLTAMLARHAVGFGLDAVQGVLKKIKFKINLKKSLFKKYL